MKCGKNLGQVLNKSIKFKYKYFLAKNTTNFKNEKNIEQGNINTNFSRNFQNVKTNNSTFNNYEERQTQISGAKRKISVLVPLVCAQPTLHNMSYSNHSIHSASTGKLPTPQSNSPNFVLQTLNDQKWYSDQKRNTSVCDNTSSFKNNKPLSSDNSFFELRKSKKRKTPISSLVTNTFAPTTKNNCTQNTNQFIQSTSPLIENKSSESDDSGTEKLTCNRLSDSLLLLHQSTYKKSLSDSCNPEKSKPHQ